MWRACSHYKCHSRGGQDFAINLATKRKETVCAEGGFQDRDRDRASGREASQTQGKKDGKDVKNTGNRQAGRISMTPFRNNNMTRPRPRSHTKRRAINCQKADREDGGKMSRRLANLTPADVSAGLHLFLIDSILHSFIRRIDT